MQFNVEKAGVRTRRELLRFVRDNFKHDENTLIVSVSTRDKECFILDNDSDNILAVRTKMLNHNFNPDHESVCDILRGKNICYVMSASEGYRLEGYVWLDDRFMESNYLYRKLSLKDNLNFELSFMSTRFGDETDMVVSFNSKTKEEG